MDLLETNYDSDEYLTGWLKSSWVSLGAECYERFLAEGRGAMFLDFANAEPCSGWADGLKVPIRYRTEDELIEEGFQESMPGLIVFVRRYEPEEQVVFLCRRRTAGMSVAFVGDASLPPKEAYENRQVKRSLTPDLGAHRIGLG